MNTATLKRIVEDRIVNLDGNAFQDMCDRLCMKLFPNDYTPVRAGGPKGDMKNDGYCPKARIFFAAHATRGEGITKTKAKIESDLEGCLENHPDVRRWIFLTNDTLVGEVEAHVDTLRKAYSGVTIETWGRKRISTKVCDEFQQSVVEEIIDMAIGPTVEITAEIDYARDLLQQSRPREARAVLERLWSQHNDAMSPRQRFRTQANIGHSYKAQGDWQEAARHFLQAKDHDPSYQNARALEALAHLILGHMDKANELSGSLLTDFSNDILATAIHIRCMPKDTAFGEIEGGVEEHLRNDPEIALALAEAAMVRDISEKAESYASKAHDQAEDNAGVKEVLADVMTSRAHVHERFAQRRTATTEEKDYLQKACGLYTSALALLNTQDHVKRVARLRLKRASVLLALEKEAEWERDCEAAYELDPSDCEVVFGYSAVREKNGDRDGAINLVETLLGKGARPIVELRLSQLLLDRNAPGDMCRSRELLMSRLDDLTQETPEVCVEYLVRLVDIEKETRGVSEALALLDSIAQGPVGEEVRLLLKAEVLRQNGNLEEAIAVAQQLQSLVNDSTGAHILRRTATLLQALGLHHDALGLWKRTVRSDYVGVDTLRAVECARRCGDIRYILDLSSDLRSNRIWDEQIFELELFYREQYNDSATEIAILQDFLKKPLDAHYLPLARLRLSVAGIRMGRDELIETNPDNLPAVTEANPAIGQHVVEVLRRGPTPMQAATYAYEMVRRHWDDPYAHQTMVRLFSPDGRVPTIEEPTCVIPGATVRYTEDDTKREHWYTIEDSQIGKPQSSLHEYAPDERLSQAMLGKKPNEQFYLVKDHIQERTATIKEVMSKYKYRFNASLQELTTRFSHTGFVREIVVAKEEGEFDFSALKRMAEKRAESVEKMVKVYRDNPCPIYLLATAAGRSVAETVEFLVDGTDVKLRCCLGSDEEQEEAVRSLESADTLVLDTTALVTLLITQSYLTVGSLSTKLAVTEGTLNDLRNAPCMHIGPYVQAGSYSVHGFTPASPENILRAKSALQNLIDWVKERCHILAGTVIASLGADYREKVLATFGNPALESMLAASQSEAVLWTDDFATALFAKAEFGCRRVWSQFVFDYSANTGALAQDISHELAVQLFGLRYYYVRPSVPIIMHAIEKCDGDVDRSPLCQVLDWFADDRAKKDGQFMIAAGTLKLLWQMSLLDGTAQSVTIRIMERFAQRPGGLDIVQGLLYNIDAIFGLDVVNAHRARQIIEAWLKGGGRKIIIP